MSQSLVCLILIWSSQDIRYVSNPCYQMSGSFCFFWSGPTTGPGHGCNHDDQSINKNQPGVYLRLEIDREKGNDNKVTDRNQDSKNDQHISAHIHDRIFHLPIQAEQCRNEPHD